MRSFISAGNHAVLVALVALGAACGGAYYDEPMTTEVVVDHQQSYPEQQPPTVVVADPNDPFAVPAPEPVYQTPNPTGPTGPRIVSGPQPQPQVVQVGHSQSPCTNSCRYANDGECDDGRPGAHTSVCAYGTDCNDCGPAAVGHQAQVQVQAGGGICTNTCRHANDNECDDGRPGAHTSLCALGSDCNDCGPAPAQQVRQRGMCTNTCRHANDNECDDGRPGSHTSLCAFGSDCNDCGPT